MKMDKFVAILEHRVIILENASDILRFSFIVQKSISYLDLKTCQQLVIRNCLENSWHNASKRANYFINTEEKCRKYFTPRRSLLYNLHLDLPRGREYHLNEGPKNEFIYKFEYIQHISKIVPCRSFYYRTINNCIAQTSDDKSKKLRILKWILEMTDSLLDDLPTHVAKQFIDFFYPVITVPELFKDFILHLDLTDWITTYEDPELVEHLIYYSQHFRNTNEEDEHVENFDEIIHKCILQRLFKNVSPILKYIDAPLFPINEYLEYLYEIILIRPDLDNEEFHKAIEKIDETRLHLIIQLVWIYLKGYLHHSDEVTLEVIRLIWCSVPAPFISFQEMRIFENGLSAEEVKNIYDFYTRAIGESPEGIKPRSLQHMCRTVIRRTLRENHHWIPEGIRKMDLPKPFQSFLNLEETLVTCEL